MYRSPGLPRSAASTWPRATSRTWTALSLGVHGGDHAAAHEVQDHLAGRRSASRPTARAAPVGFTTITGRPRRAKSQRELLGEELGALVVAAHVVQVTGVSSVPGRPSGGTPRAATLEVCTTRFTPASPGRLEHHAGALDVGAVEPRRLRRPQAVRPRPRETPSGRRPARVGRSPGSADRRRPPPRAAPAARAIGPRTRQDPHGRARRHQLARDVGAQRTPSRP